MPSNKNAVIRYLFLDQLLSDRHTSYTCKELLLKVNERLERAGYPTVGGDRSDIDHYIKSGKRVIQQDLQALQESPFNLEIDSSGRRYGSPVYTYADQTKTLFSKPLSDDEKRLLQEVLNTLGQFSGLDNFEWIEDLQAKLNDPKSFGRSSLDSGVDGGRKIISFSSNEFLRGKDRLGMLFSLISNKKVIDVLYHPFGKDERTYRVYPYLLKEYNDRWYLICTPLGDSVHPYDRDFLLNLALDRILSVSKVDGVPYVECPFDPEERYEEIVGVTFRLEEECTGITIAVNNDYVEYLETKPLHGSQYRFTQEQQEILHNTYPGFGKYTFFGLTVRPNRELLYKIFATGKNIILVSPESIRKEMEEELSRALTLMKGVSRKDDDPNTEG